MLAIFKREMKGYFTGVIGYAFLVIFLAIAAILFCYTTLFSMSANVSTYFTLMLIFSAVMLPILTMKTFSEEKKQKTEQLHNTVRHKVGKSDESDLNGKLVYAFLHGYLTVRLKLVGM